MLSGDIELVSVQFCVQTGNKISSYTREVGGETGRA